MFIYTHYLRIYCYKRFYCNVNTIKINGEDYTITAENIIKLYKPKIYNLNFSKLYEDALYRGSLMLCFLYYIKPDFTIDDLDFLTKKLLCIVPVVDGVLNGTVKFITYDDICIEEGKKVKIKVKKKVKLINMIFLVKEEDKNEFIKRGFNISNFLLLEDYKELLNDPYKEYHSIYYYNSTASIPTYEEWEYLCDDNDSTAIKTMCKVGLHIKKMKHMLSLCIYLDDSDIKNYLIDNDYNIFFNDFIFNLFIIYVHLIPILNKIYWINRSLRVVRDNQIVTGYNEAIIIPFYYNYFIIFRNKDE